MKKRVGIIGGGASGLVAAIGAARNGAEVTIIEHMDRVGTKIYCFIESKMSENISLPTMYLHFTPIA